MNRIHICLLTVAALAACGQPPAPVSPPPPVRSVEVTTTTTQTTTEIVAPPPAITTTTQAPKPPPRVTTTTTKPPPPPPPKPPDRWVLPSGLRGTIESQVGQSFPSAWEAIQVQLAPVCPGEVPCVGYALVVDGSTGTLGDCVIVEGGIKVPDPLYEKGTITFRVNNDINCAGA
ncbi:hypothetical protein ACFWN2_11210 [Lentzea sp. NPDC058436]|uniref:hypothetical protein n=1 Tax=Lentzea sp. NPDC058436 TaxID=3346499 RepID=UPI003651A5F8